MHAGSQEVDAYAGELFGDDLTNTRITGSQPKLDDKVTFGLRYGYNFTDSWGIESSLTDANVDRPRDDIAIVVVQVSGAAADMARLEPAAVAGGRPGA